MGSQLSERSPRLAPLRANRPGGDRQGLAPAQERCAAAGPDREATGLADSLRARQVPDPGAARASYGVWALCSTARALTRRESLHTGTPPGRAGGGRPRPSGSVDHLRPTEGGRAPDGDGSLRAPLFQEWLTHTPLTPSDQNPYNDQVVDAALYLGLVPKAKHTVPKTSSQGVCAIRFLSSRAQSCSRSA
jgi:hypothetical protein